MDSSIADVLQSDVGAIVQAFVDNGETLVTVRQQPDGTFIVTASTAATAATEPGAQ